ncbi:hypothetical protein N431DRAFT_465964 [Stipitochalara longipes BDJ]|nr:hypothetical protein N431DRAFT_465964 [Stipitochalara longipes BDJ]
MATQPKWFFGLELEFVLAFIYPESRASPDPTETRKVRFKLLPWEIKNAIEQDAIVNNPIPAITVQDVVEGARVEIDEGFIRTLVGPAIRADIFFKFRNAHLPTLLPSEVVGEEGREENGERFISWSFLQDTSVYPPNETEYNWMDVEVISPALEFTAENLATIPKACKAITGNYYTEITDSAGLHVHVSAGLEKTFELRTLQNLFAFLYAFEPQLDTLHPANRQSNA